MSTSSLSSTSALPGSPPVQVTGLASGLNDTQIIQELMAIDQAPVTNLQNQQSGLQALNTQLTSIQTALQGLAMDAQGLGDPGLWAPTQTISSSNTALVGAAATSTSGVGAVTGGYEVAVTALASSAQKTYSFASPSSADTVTIDGHQYNLAAGATVQDLANAVNGDSNGTAWAAVTNSNTIVFSDRATGSHTGSYLSVTDSGSALTFQSGADGQNASYSINGGTAQSSSSNTVTSAIPGVTLTLSGITGSTPATVTVGAPAPNATSIQSAVATFVKAYNSIIDQITAQTSQKPVSGDPTQGTLFGDQELGSILSSMRTAMYTPNTSLASGFQSLADIGITTGAGSGSATPSQDSIAGKLTINSTTLAAAIQSNPSNVEKLLQSFGQSFSSLVNAEAAPGGSIDARIQGDTSEISAIGNQIDNMNAALQVKQHALQAQFTAMEVALSNSQSQGSWLSGQLASLSANSIGH